MMKSTSTFLVLGVVVVTLGALVLGAARKPITPRIFEEGLTYEQATERATREKKPVFAVFSATWCGPCQVYKKGALSDPRVEAFVKEKMIPAYIDVDEQRAAAEKFSVSSIPATAVIKNGERVQGSIGLLSADELLKFLDEAARKAGRE